MKVVRVAALLALLLVVLPGVARADLLLTFNEPEKCSSCYGGAYTLKFIGNELTDSTFTVILTITTPSDSKSVVYGQYITGVNFGDGRKVTDFSQVLTNAGGSWSTAIGNLNSGATGTCNGGPPFVFLCSQQNGNSPPFGYAIADGSTYTWQWSVTFPSPGLNLDLAKIHLGAQYQDVNGSNGHIVSETGLAAPEPATAATLGIGLLLLGFRFRRKV